nr:MAG TPA: hypothetical protein [Caudoviricetes sp.]
MKYTYEPTGFTADNVDDFRQYLRTMDRGSKAGIIVAYWEVICHVEDCSGGDQLESLATDIVDAGDEPYGFWMRDLLNSLTEFAEYDGEARAGGIVVDDEKDDEWRD